MNAEMVEDGMRYTLPPRRAGWAVAIVPVWLAFWAWALGRTIRSLPKGPLVQFDNLFLLLWLTLWIYGGLAALYGALAQLVGSELVTLGTGRLKVKRSVVGVERTREFDTSRITNLRLMAEPTERRARQQLSAFNEGHIAFDYDLKTYRFGAGLSIQDATRIVQELKSRYGF